jgi:integrase
MQSQESDARHEFRSVGPAACERPDEPHSSWAHDKGVPGKVIAQLMGHAKVDTTMNVYTQVLDGAARSAADRVGSELFSIVQKTAPGVERVH